MYMHSIMRILDPAISTANNKEPITTPAVPPSDKPVYWKFDHKNE